MLGSMGTHSLIHLNLFVRIQFLGFGVRQVSVGNPRKSLYMRPLGPHVQRFVDAIRGFLTKTLRTPKSGKLLRTNKSGCINPCVSTISRRFSLYIPINVKLSVHARARLSALSPPSFNMLISINRPAVVRLLGDNGES